MTKYETLDCVAMKRQAQRTLAKALAGQSPDEQVKTLRRLVAQVPLWKSLAKARAGHPGKAAREKRRSAG